MPEDDRIAPDQMDRVWPAETSREEDEAMYARWTAEAERRAKREKPPTWVALAHAGLFIGACLGLNADQEWGLLLLGAWLTFLLAYTFGKWHR